MDFFDYYVLLAAHMIILLLLFLGSRRCCYRKTLSLSLSYFCLLRRSRPAPKCQLTDGFLTSPIEVWARGAIVVMDICELMSERMVP
jgi:hypothetical protein